MHTFCADKLTQQSKCKTNYTYSYKLVNVKQKWRCTVQAKPTPTFAPMYLPDGGKGTIQRALLHQK